MSWYVAHSIQKLQQELDARFPGRVKPDWTIGDAAHRASASDHNPRPGDGAVCAIDVRGNSTADFLWDHLQRTRDSRIKYLIYRSRIVSAHVSPWVVRHYSGHPHSDHIHISVGHGPDGRSLGPINNTLPWGIAGAAPAPEPEPPKQWSGQVDLAEDGAGTWFAVGGVGRHGRPIAQRISTHLAAQMRMRGARTLVAKDTPHHLRVEFFNHVVDARL